MAVIFVIGADFTFSSRSVLWLVQELSRQRDSPTIILANITGRALGESREFLLQFARISFAKLIYAI